MGGTSVRCRSGGGWRTFAGGAAWVLGVVTVMEYQQRMPEQLARHVVGVWLWKEGKILDRTFGRYTHRPMERSC